MRHQVQKYLHCTFDYTFSGVKKHGKVFISYASGKNIKREWGFYVHHICNVDPTDIIYVYEQFNSIIVLPIKS